uniref:Putative secreted protein n=1 Tax=Anopheles darlingi TaxID=43151 RepID=A0A2M4D1B6_ANODA
MMVAATIRLLLLRLLRRRLGRGVFSGGLGTCGTCGARRNFNEPLQTLQTPTTTLGFTLFHTFDTLQKGRGRVERRENGEGYR